MLFIGDTLLAAFPALRDRFRKLIISARNFAIAVVNDVAKVLERVAIGLLDLLSKGLLALLGAFEQWLLARIKSIESKIQGVINLVKNMIALLGQFAEIVRDVAADPGGWIRKLGSAIVNGIHYYLWDAIKTAVKNWFTGEIQQVLGLGQMLQGGMQLLDVLKKGCFTIGKIVQMAWQAMIKALPQMLIQLVIEKLVAFLVPALGGIIQIVQGVIAAYNTISSIITAIGKFVAFLKDVKPGTAARPFAQAVAAGAVALINFVANWLLGKLKEAAQPVGAKLKGIAERILAFIKRGAKSTRKGIGAAYNRAKRHAKLTAALINRGIQAAHRTHKRGLSGLRSLARRGLRHVVTGLRVLGRRLAKTRYGKVLKDIYDNLKAKYQAFKSKLAEWRAKFKKWREDRKKSQPSPEERLEAAVDRIRPKVSWMLQRGVPPTVLRLALRAMRLWYRLTDLTIEDGKPFSINALLNPSLEVIDGVPVEWAYQLLDFIHKLGEELRDESARRAVGKPTSNKISVSGAALPVVVQSGIERLRAGGGQQATTSYLLGLQGGGAGGESDLADEEGPANGGASFPSVVVTSIQQKRVTRAGLSPNVDPTNVLVKFTHKFGRLGGSPRGYADYPEFERFLRDDLTETERTTLAESARLALQGKLLDVWKVDPYLAQNARELAHWFVHVEGGRSNATFVTGMMAMDLAGINPETGERTADLADIARDYPMREKGAAGTSRGLKTRLSRFVNYLKTPQGRRPFLAEGKRPAEMAEREFKIAQQWLGIQEEAKLEAWIASLKEIDFENEEEANAKLESVKEIISERMRKAWGLP